MPLAAPRSTLNLCREADEQRYWPQRSVADLQIAVAKDALATFEVKLLQDDSE